jgi:glycosyltransferase involved in cell wall biosynthesis
MARGIPVVASPVGANREVVRHGEHGFLASTAAQWSEALHALHAEPDAALAMGLDARRRIEAEYSVQAVIGRYVELFRSLSGAAAREPGGVTCARQH